MATINEILSAIQISNQFIPTEQTEIRNTIRDLYFATVEGSETRNLLDLIAVEGLTINRLPVGSAPSSSAATNAVFLPYPLSNFAQSRIAIDSQGNLFNPSETAILVHEMIHAIYQNPNDPTTGDVVPLNISEGLYYQGQFDYLGDVETTTNIILSEIGELSQRLAIYGDTFAGSLPELQVGLNLTNGAMIDNAILRSGLIRTDNPAESSNDIMIDIDVFNQGIGQYVTSQADFRSGAGNDFLFGRSGNDRLEAGSGNDFVDGGTGNDTIIAGTGFDEIRAGFGEDTVDYRQLSGFVEATLNGNVVSVIKSSGGLDTIYNAEFILGTLQNDVFNIDSFPQDIVITINAGFTLGNPNAPTQNAPMRDSSDLKNSGPLFMQGGQDTITISQALLDAGAQTTYLTAEGQGIVWLEVNGVTQSITYSGVFNEPAQTEFFAGLTDGATVGLTETGNVMLDFSNSTQAIDNDVLNAIPLFNLVDEFVGSNLGDDIDLALTGLTDFFGGDAGDTVTGTDDSNMISGGGGDDVLSGAVGDDMLIGGAGGDTLDGGVGVDTVGYSDAEAGVRVGLAGQITQTGDAVGDSFVDIENLSGSNFNDVLYGDSASNVINGNGGSDQLRGADGADELLGGDGDDFLWGDAGADVINGGAGNDWAYYSTSSVGVTVNLATNVGLNGDAQGDTYISIERLFGSSKRDVLIGNDDVNYIRGANGDDTLSGQGGDDFLQGDAGADELIGGAGRDWATYVSSTQAMTISLADTSLNTGEAVGDTYSSVENLQGTRFDDTLYGDGNSNIIRGNDGDDMLFGGGANDFLRGDLGADVLNGGAGNDYADYINSNAAITINLGAGTASGGHAEGDSFISIERVLGSNFADQIIGNFANNYLRGAGGDDAIFGGSGIDFLEGGGGADALNGGSGTDWAYYLNAANGVTVDFGNVSNNRGEAFGDTYISIESLRGSEFGDNLTGDSGTNYITGEGGNDTLNGGAGNDTLRGDEGADTFVFEIGTFRDRVIDFDDSENDMLDFSDFGFTDIADALSNAVNVNGDVVFTIGSDVITIEDTTVTEITDNLIV